VRKNIINLEYVQGYILVFVTMKYILQHETNIRTIYSKDTSFDAFSLDDYEKKLWEMKHLLKDEAFAPFPTMF